MFGGKFTVDANAEAGETISTESNYYGGAGSTVWTQVDFADGDTFVITVGSMSTFGTNGGRGGRGNGIYKKVTNGSQWLVVAGGGGGSGGHGGGGGGGAGGSYLLSGYTSGTAPQFGVAPGSAAQGDGPFNNGGHGPLLSVQFNVPS